MSRRPRGAGNARGGRGGGRGGGGIAPPALEVPLTIPGLKAWFDSRDPAYFALGGGGEVSAWLSRAGSLGGIAWQQGTGSNQPIRVALEPLFNGLPAVLFDGANDFLDTNNQNAWKYLHDGTGASRFMAFRCDSTGGASQRLGQTSISGTEYGAFFAASAGTLSLFIHNGSGTAANTWTPGGAHAARDVSRWWMWGYSTGALHSRVSGSSLTNADASGPGASNPTRALRLGASNTVTNALKGLLVQDLHYDHVLTAGETTQLATWAASLYGVAA